ATSGRNRSEDCLLKPGVFRDTGFLRAVFSSDRSRRNRVLKKTPGFVATSAIDPRIQGTLMLTAEGCAARRKRLWDALPAECDVLVLADPQSLIYFANFAIPPFVFRASDAGGVLILDRDRATLVTDAMVKVYADGAHVDDVVDPVWYDGR